MNDLFVVPRARGLRVGERLIEACLERCAAHGAEEMEWQTAPENRRAQALYDRIGGRPQRWVGSFFEGPPPPGPRPGPPPAPRASPGHPPFPPRPPPAPPPEKP